jgi:hypothetical protein
MHQTLVNHLKDIVMKKKLVHFGVEWYCFQVVRARRPPGYDRLDGQGWVSGEVWTQTVSFVLAACEQMVILL